MTNIDTDQAPARRAPGEPIEDWRVRRKEAAAALIGGLRQPANDRLAQQVAALDQALGELGEEVSRLRRPDRIVELEGGRTFTIADRDLLALVLAMLVSFRTGGAVDVPLADGTVASGLRAGELSEIARQLLEVQA